MLDLLILFIKWSDKGDKRIEKYVECFDYLLECYSTYHIDEYREWLDKWKENNKKIGEDDS
jgi:hypothetical protein